MRTKTLASLLILCGSTAALAQVATPPAGQETTLNNTAVDDAMANQTEPTDPTTTDTMPDTAAPVPTETPDTMTPDTPTTTPPQG